VARATVRRILVIMDPIPQARVVRKGGQRMAAPPVPVDGTALGDHLRTALGVAIGLWPLTAVMLLMVGLIVMAANAGAH
jgi:hypothetical protein